MQFKLLNVISTLNKPIKISGEQVQVGDNLYDFTNLPNGTLRTLNDDIFSAKRIDGELFVDIINRANDVIGDTIDDGLTPVYLDWYSDEERESDELFNSLQPSPQQLADADLEIKMLTLLMEMEVI